MHHADPIIETCNSVTATRLRSATGKYDRLLLIALSVLVHLTLLGLLAAYRPHLAPVDSVIDQPVEMLFEAAAEPQPEAPSSTETIPEQTPEPVVPEPPVVPPAEPSETLPLAPMPVAPVPAPQLSAPRLPVPAQPSRPRPAVPRPSSPIPVAPSAGAAPPRATPPQTGTPQIGTPPVAAPPIATLAAPSSTAEAGWRSALGIWVTSHKRYPARARQRGDEGTVGIRFTVDATGRVMEVAVTRSSGSILLDDAARDMLAGQRVPPFPPGMTQAQLTLPWSIHFQLEQ